MTPAPDNPLRDRLSPYATRLLDLTETRQDEFAAVAWLAKPCYSLGVTFDDFSELIWNSDLGTEFYDTEKCKTRGMFDKKLRRAWDYAEDSVDGSDDKRQDVAGKLASLLARIQSMPWPGRGGSSERSVAIALVSYAAEINVYTVDMSIRTLVERSRLGFETVRKALARLEEQQLFTRTASRGRGKATRFNLDLCWRSKIVVTTNTQSYKGPGTSYDYLLVTTKPVTEYDHQVFTTRGLGKSSGRIWSFMLTVESATVSETVAATGLSGNTVRSKLTKMLEYGLLVKTGKRNARYFVAPGADLDAIAETLGVADYDDKLKQRHAEERSDYHDPDPFRYIREFVRNPMPEPGERATHDPFTGELIGWLEPSEPVSDPFEEALVEAVSVFDAPPELPVWHQPTPKLTAPVPDPFSVPPEEAVLAGIAVG